MPDPANGCIYPVPFACVSPVALEQNAETEAENGLNKWHAFRRPV